jgi:hypothetical protein
MRTDEFLDRLTGRWELRGLMGDTVLHQVVEARWALGDRFVEMRFRELDGKPYEAVYFVGLDDSSATYVLVLIDSTGVYPSQRHRRHRAERGRRGYVQVWRSDTRLHEPVRVGSSRWKLEPCPDLDQAGRTGDDVRN